MHVLRGACRFMLLREHVALSALLACFHAGLTTDGGDASRVCRISWIGSNELSSCVDQGPTDRREEERASTGWRENKPDHWRLGKSVKYFTM